MTTLAPTLYARSFPRAAAWVRDLLLILAGVLLLAALAQVEITLPFTPVPITGQTFGVLLVGATLGARRGAAAMIAYVAAGGLGLPFFAGGASGLRILTGATAGYLVGFALAAHAVGALCERGLERRVRTSLIPFLVGTLIIYVCGAVWLSILVGSLGEALKLGVLPFLPGDALKLVAASLTLPAAWRLVGPGAPKPSGKTPADGYEI
jgi:biotin transport system substrate-specific component